MTSQRSFLIAILSLISGSCSVFDLDKKVEAFMKAKVRLPISVDHVKIIEELREAEARDYYAELIKKEKLRLLEQYKMASNEPCVFWESDSMGQFRDRRYYLADFGNILFDSIDTLIKKPAQFMKEIRLKIEFRLLADRKVTKVSVLAAMVGFDNIGYFSKAVSRSIRKTVSGVLVSRILNVRILILVN